MYIKAFLHDEFIYYTNPPDDSIEIDLVANKEYSVYYITSNKSIFLRAFPTEDDAYDYCANQYKHIFGKEIYNLVNIYQLEIEYTESSCLLISNINGITVHPLCDDAEWP
jgi:hypothetical protein